MKKYKNLISNGIEEALSTLPLHNDTIYLTRVIFPSIPKHNALHIIENAEDSGDYTKPHKHSKPEINFIIGRDGELEYRIRLENEEYCIRSPAGVYIPAGLVHSANAIRGSGYFVCLILDKKLGSK